MRKPNAIRQQHYGPLTKMNTKDKVFLIGASIFVLVAIGLAIYDRNVCDPEWRSIEENLHYIRNDKSIVKIELYKAHTDFDINLVNHTVTITDRTEVETIRQMITSLYSGSWNRPLALWHAQMRLVLDNKTTFDIKVSKISNDKSEEMTHLYFGSKGCAESSPNCSEVLGAYLEILTGYRKGDD